MTIQIANEDFHAIDASDLPECDAMITDPPYSAHVHDNARSLNKHGARAVERDFGFASLTPEDYARTAAIAARVVRTWSIVCADWEGLHAWRDAMSAIDYVRAVAWVRWSQPQISGDRPPQGSEAVLCFHRRGAKEWRGPGNLTHFAAKALRGEGKHPAEKPLDLMLDIVSCFTAPDALVIDPYAGSGTTAQACRILGRSCLAFERDKAWSAFAFARVITPLSERDRERVKRWTEYARDQGRQLMAGAVTPASERRYEARLDDIIRAERFEP